MHNRKIDILLYLSRLLQNSGSEYVIFVNLMGHCYYIYTARHGCVIFIFIFKYAQLSHIEIQLICLSKVYKILNLQSTPIFFFKKRIIYHIYYIKVWNLNQESKLDSNYTPILCQIFLISICSIIQHLVSLNFKCTSLYAKSQVSF